VERAARRVRADKVSHFVSVAVAVERLRCRYGAAEAAKIAEREMAKARRARSRRRHRFRAEVAERLAPADGGQNTQSAVRRVDEKLKANERSKSSPSASQPTKHS